MTSNSATPQISPWPTTKATLNDDGTGSVTINGATETLDAPSIEAARQSVIDRVAAEATKLERPVRLSTADPSGEYKLAVHPDGQVEDLAPPPARTRRLTRAERDTPPPSPPATEPASRNGHPPGRAARPGAERDTPRTALRPPTALPDRAPARPVAGTSHGRRIVVPLGLLVTAAILAVTILSLNPSGAAHRRSAPARAVTPANSKAPATSAPAAPPAKPLVRVAPVSSLPVHVGPGHSLLTLAASSPDGPPPLTLTDPAGHAFTAAKPGAHVIFGAQPQFRLTQIAIMNPAAGVWRVTSPVVIALHKQLSPVPRHAAAHRRAATTRRRSVPPAAATPRHSPLRLPRPSSPRRR